MKVDFKQGIIIFLNLLIIASTRNLSLIHDQDMDWPKMVSFRVSKAFYGARDNSPFYTVNLENCTTIPQLLPDEFQIFTYIEVAPGSCIIIFPGHDCIEPDNIQAWKKIRITDVKQHWNLLPNWTPVRSVQYCYNECLRGIESVSQTALAKEKLGFTLAILYEHRDFEGLGTPINASGCTVIPLSLKRRISSLRLQRDCLVVYTSKDCNHNDDHRLIRAPPIEQRSLNTWNLGMEGRIITISTCFYYCLNSTMKKAFPSGKPWKVDVDSIHMDEGQVIMFDEPEFFGNYLNITVPHCVTLSNEWNGVVNSILFNTSTGFCLVLYEYSDCHGQSNSLRLDKSNLQLHKDLKSAKFYKRLRSLQPCSLASDGQNRLFHVTEEKLKDEGDSNLILILVPSIIGGLFCLAIVIVSLTVYWSRKRRPKETLSESISLKEEVTKFMEGYESNENRESARSSSSAHSMALSCPYDTRYELSKSSLELDYNTILGSGQFGIVYRGQFTMGTTICENVAIKTVKPSSDIQYLKALLKEIKVMIYIGKHPNIAEFFGCCTKDVAKSIKNKLLVVLKLYNVGSLDKYLTKHKSSFVQKEERDDLNNFKANGYSRIESLIEKPFNITQLIQWCIEIAEGMEYLAYKKVVHGDLATRNILLDSNLVAKITDFGLSVQLHQYYEYIKQKSTLLPWRWLSIECLRSLVFSTQSDVWSFGVTMWEIFTLGELPYPDCLGSQELLINLEQGMRLPKSGHLPDDCSIILDDCWKEMPRERPSFLLLKERLKCALDEQSDLFKEIPTNYKVHGEEGRESALLVSNLENNSLCYVTPEQLLHEAGTCSSGA